MSDGATEFDLLANLILMNYREDLGHGKLGPDIIPPPLLDSVGAENAVTGGIAMFWMQFH
jgi:hypothetical protein